MGLEDVKKELEEKIKEAEKAEGLVEEADVSEDEKPKEDVPKEEVKPEVKSDEKAAEEPKAEEQIVQKTPADYAKERRENKNKKLGDELAAANARIAALEAARNVQNKEVREESDPEPSKLDDPQGWTEWKLRKAEEKLAKTEERLNRVDNFTEEQKKERAQENLRNQAMTEIQGFEAEVRQTNPDYDNVKNYYANMLAASIKIVNPKISNEKLVKVVNDRMLMRASELLNDGYDNPIQAMYEEAKKLGYKPASNDAGIEEKVVKPDLDRVAKNRSRNAGTAAAQGDSGRGEMTKAVAATLTNAEYAKLPLAEKRRLLYGQ